MSDWLIGWTFGWILDGSLISQENRRMHAPCPARTCVGNNNRRFMHWTAGATVAVGTYGGIFFEHMRARCVREGGARHAGRGVGWLGGWLIESLGSGDGPIGP
jgi:hypothetical protein